MENIILLRNYRTRYSDIQPLIHLGGTGQIVFISHLEYQMFTLLEFVTYET